MFTFSKKHALSIVISGLIGAAALPAQAQTTSSALVGQVVDDGGSGIANATITVVHLPSNSTTVLNTNSAGRFNAKGLRVGGPYSVTVEGSQGRRVFNDVYLSLGDDYTLNVTLGAAGIEEVFVVGNYTEQATATGPASRFDLSTLQEAPAINRDIKDAIRIDPRIYINETNANDIQCAGANPRFNSLTVDGVRMNDNFGLNANGYPTEYLPFPYDAINQVAVELAPFDVQYGGFSACNINAVTKSGDNEFHGGVFFDYTNDSLFGDSLEGEDVDIGSFNQRRYGFTVGGPIIPDTLFFFVAYEKFKGAEIFGRGPSDASVGTPVEGVSQAQLDEILEISRTLYDYDPGELPRSLPVDDEKLLLKVDWNINDAHRAALTYNYNDGFVIAQADGDSDELEFSNHFYERGAKLNNTVAQLFSEWTDIFSTEIRLSQTSLDNRQLSLAGTEFGEFQIRTENGDSRATVYLGADDSRHANKLRYETLNAKFAGEFLLGNHTLSFGTEYENFDVFNLFIQEAEGEYRFSSIDDFRAGTPNRITYENASPSNDKNDAAASFDYSIFTYFIQDKYAFDAIDLTLTAGLRYDTYSTSDAPRSNPTFQEAYGFSNTATLDGLDLLQPRLGFDWQVNDQFELHGGIGIFSGGNPNVWLSNNYSNDGITQVEAQDRSGRSVFDLDFTGDGRPGYDIPQELFDQVAAGEGRVGGVNFLDPNFNIPKTQKLALGGSYLFENGITATADILYSRNKDSAIVRDISRELSGEIAPDGRPIYDNPNGRRQDFMLTNVSGDDGSQRVISFGISKEFDFGLELAGGYAFTEAKDVNPMTSSVAFSNYANLATADPENPGVATSNWEIPHRFTLQARYRKAFFGDYETKFSLFGQANEGRPFSYTFDEGFMFGDSVGFESRHLLYVPDGPTDPNVIFAPEFDTEAFFAWADSQNLARRSIVRRNELNSDWWIRFDIRIEQELPGFFDGHNSSFFFVMENVGNFLNDDWGVLYETSFPRAQPAVAASINDQGQYVYESFILPAGQSRETAPSLWNVVVGVKYEF